MGKFKQLLFDGQLIGVLLADLRGTEPERDGLFVFTVMGQFVHVIIDGDF